jgi:hypothetical protein
MNFKRDLEKGTQRMTRIFGEWTPRKLASLMTATTLAAGPALILLMAASLPLSPSAMAAPATTSAPAVSGNALTITMPKLGDPQGYRLKTVRTQRDYPFTRPKGWKILPSSVIHLSFQHGHNLLPERSSLNVLINNRILKSITLGANNITPNALDIPVPPELLKDRNTLSFQVDQHYTYRCEDPFSEELWTELLPDTKLTLHYASQPVHPNLAQYPFPLLDELNDYYPTVVGYLLPTGSGGQVSDQTLEAFGVVAAHLGQQARWRTLKTYVGDVNSPKNGDNQILIGTPNENPAIGSLSSGLPLRLEGGQFMDQHGLPLPADVGILQLVPNPRNPTRALLIVSGNGPEGVKKAAHVLAQNSLNKILTGRYAIVKDYAKGGEYPYRAWDGFLLKSGDTLANLGLDTQTTRGITGLPLFYSMKVMPDLYLPGHQKVKLHTVYSYASQLDASQSKLEVLLNGKAIKSVPLDDQAGKSLAELTVEIPTEEVHTFNDLEYRFHLYPEKYDMCRFVTDVHIWGTVHNTSWLELPGEIKSALPDVGLVNDAGFPFTGYQDLSHFGFALPDTLNRTDLEAMLQAASRLGRESQSQKGIELTAHHVSTVPDNERKENHWIVIGRRGANKWLDEVKGKASLLMENGWNNLQEEQKNRIAQINYAPGQGVVEELLSPWNDNRVLLLLTGENESAIVHDAQLFQNQAWFAAIKMGNIAVVNDDGPKSLLLLKKREARYVLAQDQRAEGGLPGWAWLPIGALSLIGLLAIGRFLFGR